MLGLSSLSTQNALATATLPLYLALRPLLRRLGQLRCKGDGPWVIGGHSGRLYEDNAAAVHARASEKGRDVFFVVQDEALGTRLQARGYRTLRRNSLEARLAIENAEVLIYSHGLSDLDHLLGQVVKLSALKIHVFHCLAFLKGERLRSPMPKLSSRRASKPDVSTNPPFDYLLTVAPRERANLQTFFPGFEDRVILGGGAHLDTIMRARNRPAGRSLLYFPTHRDTDAGRARLEREIAALVSHPRLHAFLERENMRLDIVAHVNRDAKHADINPQHRLIRWVPATKLMECLLDASTLISDFSGVLFDHLALDRPTIFFPFDLEEFQKARALYVEYGQFEWGPTVDSIDGLVELLDSGKYLDKEPFREKRLYWERECFPRLEVGYADDTLARIAELLHARRQLSQPTSSH